MKRMSLILIPSLVLLALGAAQAQTPSQAAKGKAQAQARPAMQPASAAQVDKCGKLGSDLLGNMSAGHYSKASTEFESKMGVDGGKLKKMWGQLTGKFGKMQSTGKAQHGQTIQGYTVILLPVNFGKAKLAAQIACDSKGSVADLRFGHMPGSKPPAAAKPPAASKS